MTKTLTKKWRDGELKAGWYYVKGVKKYEGCTIHWIGYPIDATERRCIEEVLDTVPSYFESAKLYVENRDLKEENKNLKNELLKKIEELEKQLKVANDILRWAEPKVAWGVEITPIEKYFREWVLND